MPLCHQLPVFGPPEAEAHLRPQPATGLSGPTALCVPAPYRAIGGDRFARMPDGGGVGAVLKGLVWRALFAALMFGAAAVSLVLISEWLTGSMTDLG